MKRKASSARIVVRAGSFAALCLSAAALRCSDSKPPHPSAVDPAGAVNVITVRQESVAEETAAPGTVRAVTTAEIAARIAGTVVAVQVREGDLVRRGQALVEIDGREAATRAVAARAAVAEAAAAREQADRALAAAEAQADLARRTLERYTYLWEQRSVSRQEYDEVDARSRAAAASFQQASARVEQARAGHDRAAAESNAAEILAGYAQVAAPFDGVVARRRVEPGSTVMPGTPLLVVEDPAHYRLEAVVDATASALLRRGVPARVELDALPGRSFDGRTSEVEQGADAVSHTIVVRIDLPPDPAIRSGLFGRAWFAREQRSMLIVPRTAVVERGQLQAVYVIDGTDSARLRVVTLGRRHGEGVEVLSGLKPGDRVVTEAEGRDLDGRRIAP